MRRMYSEKQIKDLIIKPADVVEDLKGQDINVNGITSKGIDNTGNIANTGDIASTGKITGGEIVENMSGYSANVHVDIANYDWGFEHVYTGIVKNGNKITFVTCFKLTKKSTSSGTNVSCVEFTFPEAIGVKLFPVQIGGYYYLDQKAVAGFYSATEYSMLPTRFAKANDTKASLIVSTNSFVQDRAYLIRYESTFLLSENLITE